MAKNVSGWRGPESKVERKGRKWDHNEMPNLLLNHHDEVLESASRNPLLCLICNNVYDDPRLLSCYHSFCAKCLQGRLGDTTKILCPLCGKATSLKEGVGPPVDSLLRFLLLTSSDTLPHCANCDNKSQRVPMYYCNTCEVPICNGCREETHRAKMFSAHDIIPVSKYTKETPKKCLVHGEQYIMFSTVQKSMLCINCYRDTAQDARLHCVDLETAYSQGCRKLDRAVMSLRDLQVAVRDGITMLKTVLEELRRNSDSEKSAVNAVCQTILDALTKTQENLLRDVDCQMEAKDKVIRGQLSQLRSVLPTIKLHLTMCATISNAASKYDFLDLAYPLIDRLTAITHMGYPIRPGQSSQIKSIYKPEIARTLEPWVSGVGSAPPAGPCFLPAHHPKDYAHPSVSVTSTVEATQSAEPTYSQYYPMARSTMTPVQKAQPLPFSGPPSGRKTPVQGQQKTKEELQEQLAAHIRNYTIHINEFNQRLGRLKEQVQELHRDVTLQRGTSYSSRAESALREGLALEDQLTRRHAEMERMKKLFETTWNEHVRQVREEQEIFHSQLNDLRAMKAEAKQLSSVLLQLQGFLKSVGASNVPGHQGGHGGSRHGDNKSTHLSSASEAHSRMETQVTSSFGEIPFPKGAGLATHPPTAMGKIKKDPGIASGIKSDLSRLGGRFTKAVGGSSNPPFSPTSFVGVPGGKGEMEYIQVDTSYHPRVIGPIQRPPPPQHESKKGMLSQLFDKVRHTKEDRKKSFPSGPPPPPPPPPVARAPSAKMYDAQCQYGVQDSTSAVAALALAHPNHQRPLARRDSNRPIYTRAKSFVKSKSDDERPPSKLSKHSRARSAGHLSVDPEMLLRSLQGNPKEAQRILSLYQSLSKDLFAQTLGPKGQGHYNPQGKHGKHETSSKGNPGQHQVSQGHSGSQSHGPQGHGSLGHSGSQHGPQGHGSQGHGEMKFSGGRSEGGDFDMFSEDDYQQIFPRMSRPDSAQLRKPCPTHGLNPGHYSHGRGRSVRSAEVKVHVHEEPRSTRSSPAATLSKSLEESYLYGFLREQKGRIGGSHSASSTLKPIQKTGKKGNSCESLISLHSRPNSRKSSIDFDRRSVVTIRRAGSKPRLGIQHSWDAAQTMPSRSTLGVTGGDFSSASSSKQSTSTPLLSPDELRRPNPFEEDFGKLHKADSFEGHEEAVRSIVAAVKETRTQQRKLHSGDQSN